MKIDELYFGIKLWYGNHNLETVNLFDLDYIKAQTARYIKEINKEKPDKYVVTNPLMFVFGDVWSRCEYEYLIDEFPNSEKEEPIKVDVFGLYVKPNEKLLMKMVNEISLKEATKYLGDNK